MSWRKDLFVVGRRYRVKKAFPLPPWPLVEGEVVRFVRDYYSPYDDASFYEFVGEPSGSVKFWLLSDDDSDDKWKDIFELIA